MKLKPETRDRTLRFLNAAHGRHFDVIKQALYTDMRELPVFRLGKGDALLIPGGGEVMGAKMRRAAELIAAGIVSRDVTIYVIGGMKPLVRARQRHTWDLLKMQADAGIETPSADDLEGPFGARILPDELRRLGVDPDGMDIRWSGKGEQLDKTIPQALDLGLGEHDVIGVLDLGYIQRRTIGALRLKAGNRATICSYAAWVPEAGITEEIWEESPLARRLVDVEGRSTVLPDIWKAKYVRDGYCLPVNIQKEREKIEKLLAQPAEAWRIISPGQPSPRPRGLVL